MNSQLWDSLSKSGLVISDTSVTENKLKEIEIGSPWYVKVLLAFSGWLASLFTIVFVFVLFSNLYKNTPALITFGGIFIIGSFFLLHKKSNEFLEHVALALSLTGQVLIVFAIDNLVTYNEEAIVWLTLAAINLPLALIMPNFVHRVVSAFITSIGFVTALYFFSKSSNGIVIYSAITMLVTALVWLNEFRFPRHIEKIQAIGYGLVLALVAIKGVNVFSHTDIWASNVGSLGSLWFKPWMTELLLSAVTLYVVWQLLQRSQSKPSQKAIILSLAGVLLLTLLSMQAQGLMTGAMIVLLGYSASNRILIGLGIIALLLFISSYYYLLENTLMEKSITLLILGITLLIGRFIILKLLPDNKNTSQSQEASS